MSEREPDIDDDPRQQGTGQGYPEANPESATPTEGSKSGPEADAGGSPQEERAPDTEGGSDESPSNASGNPGAAGG